MRIVQKFEYLAITSCKMDQVVVSEFVKLAYCKGYDDGYKKCLCTKFRENTRSFSQTKEVDVSLCFGGQDMRFGKIVVEVNKSRLTAYIFGGPSGVIVGSFGFNARDAFSKVTIPDDYPLMKEFINSRTESWFDQFNAML